MQILRLFIGVYSSLFTPLEQASFSVLVPRQQECSILETFFITPVPGGVVEAQGLPLAATQTHLLSFSLEQLLRLGKGSVVWPAALPSATPGEKFALRTSPHLLNNILIGGRRLNLITCSASSVFIPFVLALFSTRSSSQIAFEDSQDTDLEAAPVPSPRFIQCSPFVRQAHFARSLHDSPLQLPAQHDDLSHATEQLPYTLATHQPSPCYVNGFQLRLRSSTRTRTQAPLLHRCMMGGTGLVSLD